MSENYTPVSWDENTPINVSNLDNMDGQYQAAKEVVQDHEVKDGGVHGVDGNDQVAGKSYVDTKVSGVRTDENAEFRVEVRNDDPASPAVGRIWLRSDL